MSTLLSVASMEGFSSGDVHDKTNPEYRRDKNYTGNKLVCKGFSEKGW
jgi:hypothetical protein